MPSFVTETAPAQAIDFIHSKQLRGGVTHRLILLVEDLAADGGIGLHAEDDVGRIQLGTDCDAGEIIVVLIESLLAISRPGPAQDVFAGRHRRETELAVARERTVCPAPPLSGVSVNGESWQRLPCHRVQHDS